MQRVADFGAAAIWNSYPVPSKEKGLTFVGTHYQKSSALVLEVPRESAEVLGQVPLAISIQKPTAVPPVVRHHMLEGKAAVLAGAEHRKDQNCSWAQDGCQRIWWSLVRWECHAPFACALSPRVLRKTPHSSAHKKCVANCFTRPGPIHFRSSNRTLGNFFAPSAFWSFGMEPSK